MLIAVVEQLCEPVNFVLHILMKPQFYILLGLVTIKIILIVNFLKIND